MVKEIKKNKAPTCACGRVDLYDDWLKQNEKEKDETRVSLNPKDIDITGSQSDSTSKNADSSN